MSLSRKNSSRNKADSLLFRQRVQGKPKILYKGTQFGVSYRAAVQSPVTGSEEIVVSEPYASNVAEYISNNSVTVHYSENGEYWIQL